MKNKGKTRKIFVYHNDLNNIRLNLRVIEYRFFQKRYKKIFANYPHPVFIFIENLRSQ